jgi:predicted HicB family RNase H-like nuclease
MQAQARPMKKPSSEIRSAAMHVKVTPSVKAKAEAMAAADRRSLADWLSLLVEAEDARRRKAHGGAP